MPQSYRVLNPDGSVSRCYTGPGCRLHDAGIKAYTKTFQQPADTIDAATFRQEFEANLRAVPVAPTEQTVSALTDALRATAFSQHGEVSADFIQQLRGLTDPDSIRVLAENTPKTFSTTEALLLNPHTPADILDSRVRGLTPTARAQILGHLEVPLDTVRLLVDSATDNDTVTAAMKHLPQQEARELALANVKTAAMYLEMNGWPKNDEAFELELAELAQHSRYQVPVMRWLAQYAVTPQAKSVVLACPDARPLFDLARNHSLTPGEIEQLMLTASKYGPSYLATRTSIMENPALPQAALAKLRQQQPVPRDGEPGVALRNELAAAQQQAAAAQNLWEHPSLDYPSEEAERFAYDLYIETSSTKSHLQTRVDSYRANHAALASQVTGGMRRHERELRKDIRRGKRSKWTQQFENLRWRLDNANALLLGRADAKTMRELGLN